MRFMFLLNACRTAETYVTCRLQAHEIEVLSLVVASLLTDDVGEQWNITFGLHSIITRNY